MITLDKMLPADWEAVKQIYEEGIATGNATFQQQAPNWEEWNNDHLSHSRIIAKEDGTILGWAALTPVSGRCVYAGVAEVSVYVSDKARGKGLGKKLLQKLIEKVKQIISGHYRQASSPKTWRALKFIMPPAFGHWASEKE